MTSDPIARTILLVEDDPLLGATMRRYLERWSSDVRVAETCAEAVAAWAAMPPGIALVDYRLPDGYGTDAISTMRAKGREDPAICMTGEAENVSPELQAALRIRRVLGKPVKLDVLRQELDALEGEAPRAASPSGETCVRLRKGKFRQILWRGPLSARRMACACKAARSERWVAVDVTRAGEAEPAAWRGLCAWSGWLSGIGGRLCVVTGDGDQLARVRREVGEYVDVVESVATVEAQAARLTGEAERRQLLGLVAAHGPKGVPNG